MRTTNALPVLRRRSCRPARRAHGVALGLTAALLMATACSPSTTNASSSAPTTAPPASTSAPGTGPTETGTTGSAPPGANGAATAVEVTTDDAFYAVPDPIPSGPHGTLLKYQKVDGLVPDGVAYKVMYLSESLRGEPIVVTGQAVIPSAPAPPGGRPVLATAHGTTGVADECAPSKKPGSSEIKQMGPIAVRNNWLVTETDYEGLGTPGRHPYLVGESEGRSVIDSVKAAGQLPGAAISTKVAIAGYSQGGHGALWANEIAATWAPELEVVGTFAGAPATELGVILASGRALPIGGFILSIVAGYQAAYPQADPSRYLTPAGMGVLDAVDKGCTSSVFKAAGGIAPADLVKADGPEAEPWKQLALDNNPGQVATEAPILIIHSDQDTTVPVGLSAVLHDRQCSHGQVVERRVLVGGGNHGAAAVPAYTQGLAWLQGRFAGVAPVNDCPTTTGTTSTTSTTSTTGTTVTP